MGLFELRDAVLGELKTRNDVKTIAWITDDQLESRQIAGLGEVETAKSGIVGTGDASHHRMRPNLRPG